ncbi:MAG: hypothetical protein CMI36_00430 [Owenweeksia sp.]|nr:hypothetical protein [Owenweeksia sp.]MBF97431.1 hypothetical protein [Owenweeksia sp.]HBF18613.1 hypothetical protein [Cryomorphaceae bacterium]|tara:strand:- start:693 stop:1118 length:426 start_codon:yes stop_codon:yes gene_type:complete
MNKKIFYVILICIIGLSCHHTANPSENLEIDHSREKVEVVNNRESQKSIDSNFNSSKSDSIFLIYYPSGGVYEKKIFLQNGDRKIISYTESGDKKSESDFYSNGKTHFRKYNPKGEVALEHIKMNGKVVLDTTYWDKMFEE